MGFDGIYVRFHRILSRDVMGPGFNPSIWVVSREGLDVFLWLGTWKFSRKCWGLPHKLPFLETFPSTPFGLGIFQPWMTPEGMVISIASSYWNSHLGQPLQDRDKLLAAPSCFVESSETGQGCVKEF